MLACWAREGGIGEGPAAANEGVMTGLVRTSLAMTARAQGHSHRAPDRQLTRQSLPANPMRPPMAPLRVGKRRSSILTSLP